MYACVDVTRMAFLYTHQDASVLSKLAFIETPHLAVKVHPCDAPSDFEGYTDLELRLLYKHTTEGDHTSAHRPTLLASCFALAQQLPPRDKVDAFSLDLQYRAIRPGDERKFVYVPGASVPMPMDELFELPIARCEQRWGQAQIIAVAQRAPAAAATPAAPVQRPSSAPATPAPRVVAPQRGGTRTVIWQVMDVVWEQAGKPTEMKTVLALRKHAMDELGTKHGVNRSTASCELGNWQKARCAK